MAQRSDVEPLLQAQLDRIDKLFDDPGLGSLRRRSPLHPAIIRYDKILDFIMNKRSLIYPDEAELTLTITDALLDMNSSDQLSADNFVSSLGEPEVIKYIRERLREPKQFNDQMAAITLINMLRASGLAPKLIERSGFPDIAVPLEASDFAWIEVKHLTRKAGLSRVRKIIKKANKQIKSADSNGSGVLFIFIDHPQKRYLFSNAVPDAIKLYLNEIEREIFSGCARSIAAVMIAWDNYMIVGDVPDPTLYVVSRQVVVREHPAPRQPLRLQPLTPQLGRTVVVSIAWSRAAEQAQPAAPSYTGKVPGRRVASRRVGNVQITEMFKRECELPGYVRYFQVVEALQDPDRFQDYLVPGDKIFLATKWVTSTRKPFCLLILGIMPEEDSFVVEAAYRVYDYSQKIDVRTHPMEIFSEFLRRYGVEVSVGDYRGLFLPHLLLDAPEKEDVSIIKADWKDRGRVSAYAFFQLNDTDPRTVDIWWAFAISQTRYGADVKRHRR